jgi:hypothetical protein
MLELLLDAKSQLADRLGRQCKSFFEGFVARAPLERARPIDWTHGRISDGL